MLRPIILAAILLAAAAIDFQKEEFREEDLPQIFRELSERHSRIERFSKDLAKQTNMANRESSILQSAMLPRPPINNPLDPLDNRLPDLPERSTVVTTKSIETGHTDYETESVIASPPPPLSSDSEQKKFLLSERFFKTSTNQPRARAAPTLPSINVLPLSTPAVEEPSTTESPTTTTTFATTRTPTTPPAVEAEEERADTVTLPTARRTTPRALRGLRPLSFPPLPKFLPTRRNALPERNDCRNDCL